jgi:hypothetical protein
MEPRHTDEGTTGIICTVVVSASDRCSERFRGAFVGELPVNVRPISLALEDGDFPSDCKSSRSK